MRLRFAPGFAPPRLIGASLVMCAALSSCVTPDNGTTKDPVTRDDSKEPTDTDGGTDPEDTGPGDETGFVTGAPPYPRLLGDSPQYPSDDGAGGGDDEGGGDAEESGDDGADEGEEGAAPSATEPVADGDAGVASGDEAAARIVARATNFAWAGDVLFALAPQEGLAALDLSDPSALQILDTTPSLGFPAEMLQVNDALLVIERDDTTKPDGQGGQIVAPTVNLEAFEVSDPTELSLSERSTIPGVFIASRRVGDVLYLVTSDDCDYGVSEGRVLVTSFDLTEAPRLAQIDQLALATGEYSVCDGPVSVSAQRIYIGRTYGGEGEPRSQVRVVDISDAGGELLEGTTLDVEGNVSQFDEYGGVLRLFAQRVDSKDSVVSLLSMFTFTDAGETVLEGQLPFEVAEPQWFDLTFDGERAFAPYYYEDSQRLLTFDLSDPAAPEQVAQLDDLPRLLSLEPRGDRLYTVGLGSEGNQTLTVLQAIDVRDLEAPAVLSQVQFVGTEEGSNLPTVALHLDQGLIVAWDGLSQSEHPACGYQPSEIRLIKLDGDALELSGRVAAKGPISRALLHSQQLVTLSAHGVETFDVSDHAAPKPTDQFAFTRQIAGVVPVGDALLRLGREGDVDVTQVAHAAERQGTAALPLATVDQACTWGSWGEARTVGNVVYLPRFGDENHLSLSLLVVDVEDPEHPEVVRELNPRLPEIEGAYPEDQYFSNVYATSKALLVERVHYASEVEAHTSISYEVFTLDDPLNPKSVASIDVPDAIANAGWAAGGEFRSSSLVVAGDTLVSWHFVPLADDPLRGRYYLDRLDVSQPKHPEFREPVNVPGLVVRYEPESETLVTSSVAWTKLDLEGEAEDECWLRWASHDPAASQLSYRDGQSSCARGERSIHQLSLLGDAAKLERTIAATDDDWAFSSLMDLDGVILLRQFTWEFDEEQGSYRTLAQQIVVLDMALEPESVSALPSESNYSEGRGDGRLWERRSGPGPVFVFDPRNPKAPSMKEFELETEYCSALQIAGDYLYCGRDDGTVEVVALE